MLMIKEGGSQERFFNNYNVSFLMNLH